jgi:hypothetical protein
MNYVNLTFFVTIVFEISIVAFLIYRFSDTNNSNSNSLPPNYEELIYDSFTYGEEETIITIPSGFTKFSFVLIGGGGSGGNASNSHSGGGGGGGAYRTLTNLDIAFGNRIRILLDNANDNKNGMNIFLFYEGPPPSYDEISSFRCDGGTKGGNGTSSSGGAVGLGGANLGVTTSGGNGKNGVINSTPSLFNGGDGGYAGGSVNDEVNGQSNNGANGLGTRTDTFTASAGKNYGGGGGGGGNSTNDEADKMGNSGGSHYWIVTLNSE